MANCTLEWTDLSQKSRCMRNMLFFIFCNLIPFHISILLEVAATNRSQFGFPPGLYPKSRLKQAALRTFAWFGTTGLFSFLGIQGSVCDSDPPFSNPEAPLHAPASFPSMWFAGIRGHPGAHMSWWWGTGHLSQACLATPSTLSSSSVSLGLCLGKWPSSSLFLGLFGVTQGAGYFLIHA